MLLPQTKEREYRFKLALRMSLPVFALIIAFISYALIGNYDTLQATFYFETVILLVFSIYFILYLIYSGFEVKITDNVSKTFTREYLFKYLKKEIKKNSDYTLILISIDNLNDINTKYGIKNGDKVLQEVVNWFVEYLKYHKIENFPLGHIKGGDFIIGLPGLKDKYNTILELMCLKSDELKVENIEVKISGAIQDTNYSRDLDYMVENLFELQEEKRNSKNRPDKEDINPNELESFVIDAINKRSLSMMFQDIYENDKAIFKECFVKLKTDTGKFLYPKRYLKVVDKLGLSINYDLMILEEIVLKYSENSGEIYAVNISPTSLRNENFLSKTKELLKYAEIKLMFILSEQEYFSYISRYNSIINSLRSMGVLITIDRLGSIHTSFLYLRELNIDVIRFDTYYSNQEKIKNNLSIIEGFNLMAHAKSVKTWIKNIENVDTFELVKSMKIDYIQGKYLSNLEN